jgi:hypothetical protein
MTIIHFFLKKWMQPKCRLYGVDLVWSCLWSTLSVISSAVYKIIGRTFNLHLWSLDLSSLGNKGEHTPWKAQAWLDYALTCGFNLARKPLPTARFHKQRSLRTRREACSALPFLKLSNNCLISRAFLGYYEKYHANIYSL